MAELLHGKGTTRPFLMGVASHISLSRLKTSNKTWGEVVATLKKYKRAPQTQAEYNSASKDERHKIKDLGHFVLGRFRDDHRLAAKCVWRDAVTIDLDSLPENFNWRAKVDKALRGHAYLAYTTFSHTPEKPKIRVVVPTDRAMSPEEYEPVTRALAERIHLDGTDPRSYAVAQAMFWPGCPADGKVEYSESRAESEFLSVDSVLNDYLDWRDQSEWPFGKDEKKKAVNSTGKKAQDPRVKKGVIGAFCRTYGIRDAIENFLPEVYTPSSDYDNRYTYVNGSTSNGAILYGEDDQDDLFLYSNHATDPAGQQLVNAFDLVRLHLFGDLDQGVKPGTPVSRLSSYKEMVSFAKEQPEVAVELANSNRPRVEFDDLDDQIESFVEKIPEQKAPSLSFGSYYTLGPNPFGLYDDAPDMMMDTRCRVPDPSKSDDNPEWLVALKGTLNMVGTENPVFDHSSVDNLVKILSKDAYLRGAFRYNRFIQAKVICKDIFGVPVRNKVNGDRLEDHYYPRAKLYFERVYGMKCPTGLIIEAIEVVSSDNSFNPIQDAFNSPEYPWDGVPRLDTWLSDYLGAEDCPLNRAFAAKSLMQVVRRILDPGCKADHMVILYGSQGVGKSTALRVLGMELYTDAIAWGMDDKEIAEVTAGVIIAEIAELSSRRASAVEHAKHLITRQVERCRPAYARETKDYPRTFALFGTTNTDDFINDPSGNRRYWPVEVRKADCEKLKPVVWQLYREAQARLEAGEKSYLEDPALLADLEVRHKGFTFDSGSSSDIHAFLDQPIAEGHWDRLEGTLPDLDATMVERDRVHPKEIWIHVLGGKDKEFDIRAARRVALEMAKVDGWVKSPNGIRFGRRFNLSRGYVRQGEIE